MGAAAHPFQAHLTFTKCHLAKSKQGTDRPLGGRGDLRDLGDLGAEVAGL